jgi:hypothetical protein
MVEAEDSGALPRPPLGEGTALSAALEGRLGKSAALGLEGFYTAATLPSGESSGWFSETPPLPPQNFSLYGMGLLLTTNYLSVGGDLAWSRTSILGRDLYASLGFRAGNRGTGNNLRSRAGGDWQLSLAVDGAGRNYTGSDGTSPGAAFRAGGKFEWRHSRAGLFRINTSLSGPGFTPGNDGIPDLSFNRSSSGFYYRPPSTTLPLRFSQISLAADRATQDTGALMDSVALSLGLAANPQVLVKQFTGTLVLNLSGSLAGSPTGDWGQEETDRPPWPVPSGPYRFESFKIAGDLSWSGGTDRRNLRLKAGLDYTVKAPTLEEDFTKSRNFDLQAVLSGDRGRISITLSCPAFPWENPSPAAPWDLSLSWKLEK